MGVSLKKEKVDLGKVKAVIFDVDGTLYDQGRLRKKMLRDLLFHYSLRPWRYKELQILQAFRKEREEHAGTSGNIEHAQYRWCSERVGCREEEVRRVVAKWIFQHPARYLEGCLYPGTKAFLNALRVRGVKVAIYSDYKAEEKLHTMGLQADLVVSSTDPEVDRLKPDPAGLLHVAATLGLRVEQCLFIGDRQEMDGECAERAGMPYMIIEEKASDQFSFYHDLGSQLNKIEAHGASVNAA